MPTQVIKISETVPVSGVRPTHKYEALAIRMRFILDVRSIFVDDSSGVLRISFHSTNRDLVVFPNKMIGGSPALLRTTFRQILDALDDVDAQFK